MSNCKFVAIETKRNAPYSYNAMEGDIPGIRHGIKLLHYSDDGAVCQHCLMFIYPEKEEWTDSEVMHDEHPLSCKKISV